MKEFKQITLSKKFSMQKERGFHFFHADGYFSDGRFLVKDSIVKNRDDYIHDPRAKFNEGQFLRVIPDLEECKEFTKTNILFDMGFYVCRMFKSEFSYNLINEEFVKCFGLDVLYSKGIESPLSTKDKFVVVMPMRVGKLQDEICSVMHLFNIAAK